MFSNVMPCSCGLLKKNLLFIQFGTEKIAKQDFSC